MDAAKLHTILNQLLAPEMCHDYCPNGLQVEGVGDIEKIVTGVTASEALIDKAIELQANAVLVHHGYFWKSESPVISGMKRRRIKKLLDHNLSLFAYHLPLDVHDTLGNNMQLAQVLKIQNARPMPQSKPNGIVWQGELTEPMSGSQLKAHIETCLARVPTHVAASKESIKSIAWCTGGGQHYIDFAAQFDIDAFISGEISEQTTHSAVEQNIHYFAAGHHASERYGVKAVGEYLRDRHGLDVSFVDLFNPA